MALQFLISHDSPALFITVATKARIPVFRTDWMKEFLCLALDEARKSAGILLFAYVLMWDHMHLLTSCNSATSDVLRYLKGITARRVIDHLKEKGHFSSLAKLQHEERNRNHQYSLWQTERNVLPVFSEGMFMEKVNYIHQNPVRAGLSERAEDYRWSSARIWRRRPLESEPLLIDNELIHWRRKR
jgi:REP element-mobilizing transposase RayT